MIEKIGRPAMLSDRMIEYRARENISQAELAARVGVDRGVINKAENGKHISRLTEAKIELVLKGAHDGKTNGTR